MRKCADCGRRGLLLRLDVRGFCEDCARRLEQRVERRVGRIRSALAAVDAACDVDWIIEELGRAKIQCQELVRLERSTHGRPSPRTEILQRTVTERRDRVLNNWAETVAGAAVRQLERLDSRDQKETLLQEAVKRLQGYEGKVTSGEAYRDHQRELSSRLVRLRAEPSIETVRGETLVPGSPALELASVEGFGKPDTLDETPAAAAPEPVDRRRSSRRRRQFYVTLSPGGDRCLSEDVSSTGILLHSPEEQRVGDFLDLHLHTAKGRYSTTGIVVWTGIAGGARSLPNSVGVAFTGEVPVAAA